MKITIILLIAVACFAAGNSASYKQPDSTEILVNEGFSDEINDIEAKNIFSGFYWYVKAALRTLKGVNCSIKQAIIIKSATENYLDNIDSCGADAVKSFKKVITSAQSVVATCNNIIKFNKNICNNDECINGKCRTPFRCFIKLLIQFIKLKNQIKNTVYYIKNVPTIPGEAAICADNAANELISVFNAFPSNVKTCSKLTS